MNPWAQAGIAGAGAVGGGISGYMQAGRNKKMYSDLIAGADTLQSKVDESEKADLANLQQQYGPMLENAPENIKNYYSQLADTDLTQFDVAAPGEFQFDLAKETQAQLNPEIDAIIGRATGAVQQSAANRGNLFSGAAAKGISRASADIMAKEWDSAANRAQTQQSQKYQQYTDKFTNLLRSLEMNKSNLTGNLANLGKVAEAQTGTMQKKIGQEQDITSAANQNSLNISADKIKNQAALSGQPGEWESAITGFLGGGAKSLGSTYGIQ